MLTEHTFITPLIDEKKIRIGYIGSFYYSPNSEKNAHLNWYQKRPDKWFSFDLKTEDWSYRSPVYFLKTFKQLLIDHPELKSKITFEHIGNTPAWFISLIDELELSDNFVTHGFVTHQKVLEIQNKFDYLLATSEKRINGNHYSLPSKLFDYLQSSKAILGFVTSGTQKEFLEKSGVAEIFNPDEIEYNSKKLYQVLTTSKEMSLNLQYLNSFNREVLTMQLAEVIKSVSKR